MATNLFALPGTSILVNGITHPDARARKKPEDVFDFLTPPFRIQSFKSYWFCLFKALHISPLLFFSPSLRYKHPSFLVQKNYLKRDYETSYNLNCVHLTSHTQRLPYFILYTPPTAPSLSNSKRPCFLLLPALYVSCPLFLGKCPPFLPSFLLSAFNSPIISSKNPTLESHFRRRSPCFKYTHILHLLFKSTWYTCIYVLLCAYLISFLYYYVVNSRGVGTSPLQPTSSIVHGIE